MDIPFVSGLAAFVSAIVIFVGSAMLLLTLILGVRLAYFITASITLAFVLIMGVVWSINPLGPVGELPEFTPIDISTDLTDLEQAAGYPEGEWRNPNPDEATELTQGAEIDSAAGGALEDAISEGTLEGLEPASQSVVADEATKLLTQGDKTYGATTLEVIPPGGGEEDVTEVYVTLEYDPGNPLGMARSITAGTFVLFVVHLIGLSLAERKVRAQRAQVAT